MFNQVHVYPVSVTWICIFSINLFVFSVSFFCQHHNNDGIQGFWKQYVDKSSRHIFAVNKRVIFVRLDLYTGKIWYYYRPYSGKLRNSGKSIRSKHYSLEYFNVIFYEISITFLLINSIISRTVQNIIPYCWIKLLYVESNIRWPRHK